MHKVYCTSYITHRISYYTIPFSTLLVLGKDSSTILYSILCQLSTSVQRVLLICEYY